MSTALPSRSRIPRAGELNDTARSRLFVQFATLDRSGIPLLQALPIIIKAAPAVFRRRLELLSQTVRRGISLAEGGGGLSGLFLPWEARLIRAAEEAGNLQATFAQLAQHYERRAQRWRKIKSRMAYPMFMLFIAFFVMPLPALISGAIDGGGYLARSALPLALLLTGLWLLGRAYRRLLAGERGGVIARLLQSMPLARRQLKRDLLSTLSTLLKAGVPALAALEHTRDSVADPVLRGRFVSVRHALDNGAGVTEALAHGGLIDDEGRQLLNSGEFAGRLEQMLDYYVARLDDGLQRRVDLLAEWLPRLAYALVVIFIASGLLG